MPRERMKEQQVSAYLQMDIRELRKLSSRGLIPCRKIGGEFLYTKVELDHWVFERMASYGSKKLEGLEKGVNEHHGYDHNELTICPMIPDGGIAVPLVAKTREAVIRRMVDLADNANLVYGRDELLDEIRKREELCSTALFPNVAMPHPRIPLPYDIADSFVVVGVTSSGIPYGAEDGSLTRLFFLIVCKDDSTHLHVLARLARLLLQDGAVDQLVESESPEELLGCLQRLEPSLIE